MRYNVLIGMQSGRGIYIPGITAIELDGKSFGNRIAVNRVVAEGFCGHRGIEMAFHHSGTALPEYCVFIIQDMAVIVGDAVNSENAVIEDFRRYIETG